MATVIGGLIRRVFHKDNTPLNVLTCPTHERFEYNLAQTGHQFFALYNKGVKTWNRDYAAVPDNYHLLVDGQLPPDVNFDVVVIQNKFGQYQLLAPIARSLQLPMCVIEHTAPHPGWPPGQLANLKEMKGHTNVFISEWSRDAWGWKDNEATVVHHGVDTQTFLPAQTIRKPHVLSVVNDFRNRDVWCGYKLWESLTSGLPRLHVGSSPDNWSQPARSTADLVRHYRETTVFLNTSLASPIPTVLLEAMACGSLCISTATCMCPEVIKDGVNGFISNDTDYLRRKLEDILKNPDHYAHLRQAARKTILERFSVGAFTRNWDRTLRETAHIIPYKEGYYL